MARLLRAMSWYPPFLGSGTNVVSVKDDLSLVINELKQSAATQNFVGTQYGARSIRCATNVGDEAGVIVASVEKVLHAHKPSMKPKPQAV